MRITITETRTLTYEMPPGASLPQVTSESDHPPGVVHVSEYTRWLEGYGITIANAEWSRPTRTHRIEP